MSEASKPNALVEWYEAIRRRRTAIIVTASGVFLLALLVAMLLPASYRATGTILIEQQEIPTELVRSAISSFADQRIQVITQRVMTSENLLKIIDRYNLYPKMRQNAPREKILKRMREDINFGMISADVIDPREGRPVKASIAFSVSYESSSPDLAARVANELVSLYMQVNIENRRRQAATSTNFLTDEADTLSKHIADLQARIAVFKEKNLKALPEQTQLNTQLMNHSEDELRDIETQIRSLDQQIVYLDGQLAQLSPSSQVYTSTGERVLSPSDRLKYLRTEYARVSALYSPDHPDVISLQREIESLENATGDVDSVNDLNRQLEEAQTQLDAARQKYAPGYPDVVRQERLVSSLKDKIAKAAAKPYTTPASTAKPDNPAYIQLKAQEQAAVNERASLQTKREELHAKLGEFETRLSQAPNVERDYLDMTRELEDTQVQYRQILQKQNVAKESQSLENEDKGERFTLIEPPIPPQEPSSPNRLAISLLGLVLALAAAAGITALLEMLDGSVRSRHDLQILLTVPPLAVLPAIETRADIARKKLWRRLALGGVLVSFIAALCLVHFLYKPLDVLWQIALRKVTD